MEWPSFEVFVPDAKRNFCQYRDARENIDDNFEDLQAVSPKNPKMSSAENIPSVDWPEITSKNHFEGSQMYGLDI